MLYQNVMVSSLAHDKPLQQAYCCVVLISNKQTEGKTSLTGISSKYAAC